MTTPGTPENATNIRAVTQRARDWWENASSKQRTWAVAGACFIVAIPLTMGEDPAPTPETTRIATPVEWEAIPDPPDGSYRGTALERERVTLSAFGWDSWEHGCGDTQWACYVVQVDANNSGELVLDLSVALAGSSDWEPAEAVAMDASADVLAVLAPLDPDLEQVRVRSADGVTLTSIYREGWRAGAGADYSS